MTPANAEAEYVPQASTTYAVKGTNAMMSDMRTQTQDRRNMARGSLYSADQPYKLTAGIMLIPPRMAIGRRYSGRQRPLFLSRSLM